MSIEERFFNFVQYNDITGCWDWIGAKNNSGYGTFYNGNKNSTTAHRISYELYMGSIPANMIVRHICRNKCVNPDHLELGTKQDNENDKIRDNTLTYGEKNGSSKLTTDIVKTIRKSNKTQRELSKQYNVSEATISLIINNITWRHLL
jgi:hypothetical protein